MPWNGCSRWSGLGREAWEPCAQGGTIGLRSEEGKGQERREREKGINRGALSLKISPAFFAAI